MPRRGEFLHLALGLLVLLSVGTTSWAGQPVGREEQIRDAVVRIDRAGTAIGEAETLERLAATFKAKPRIVLDLRDQKLSYGQVTVVLALAEAGKTSADTILGLWATDRLNWGQIAERLKIDQRDLLRRLDDARHDLGRRKP